MAISATLVQQAYLAYFGRPADPGGLNYWVTQSSVATMDAGFAASTEFTNLYAGMSVPQQVNQVYENVLGRGGDPGGLIYWIGQLTSGAQTISSLVTSILAVVATEAPTSRDPMTVANRLTYSTAFTAAVAASATEIVNYSGTVAANAARTAMANITYTTTAATLSTQPAIDAATVSTAGAPTTTFTLTTGVDSIAPAGNSSIIGNINTNASATNNTLNALDSINATGTGNVLNVTDQTGGAFPTITVSGVQTANITSAKAETGVNTTAWTGLTALTVSELAGGSDVTSAATTNITFTDSALAALTDSVQGGLNVAVTESGVTGAAIINVGTVAGAAGTVAVTENFSTTATGAVTAAAINVTGGTIDTVTANLLEKAGAGNTVTSGLITVTGGSATTSVTVNQSATATASAAVAANAGVSQSVIAAAAAPGTNKVAVATATQVVAAAAAVAGVVDGVVTVNDVNHASTTLANTITTVALSNYATASAINSNALTTVSLSGVNGASSTLTITNAAAVPTNTTLALTLNGEGTTGNATTVATVATITDANHEIKILNVTTAGADSNVVFTDASLTTLNVAGTNVLNLSTLGGATIGTIAVSGSAGFNDNGLLAGEGASLTSFTTTSSGVITATLDDTNQTFTGSTGQDIITISADATKVIKGGSATNNEIVMNAASSVFNATAAHLTNANVTGFTTLGLGNSSTGTFDMSTLNSGFNAIDDQATTAVTSVIKAATGTSLTIDNTDTGAISLAYANTTGSTDTTAVTIGESNNGAGSAVPTAVTKLTLADANAVGIATLNLVSSGADTDVTAVAAAVLASIWTGLGGMGAAPTVAGAYNGITTLVDNGLSTLNVTGGAGLVIGTLNEATTQATSMTINSAETGIQGTMIGILTDANLGNLTFTGSNSTQILDLLPGGGTVTTIAMSNTGTGAVTIGGGTGLTDAILTTLNLNGNINLTTGSLAATTGITVAGSTDNSHVTISLAGAAATHTDSITLGTANNNITDTSIAGTVNVNVGTGSNLIVLGGTTTDTTGAYNITLGTHTLATGPDSMTVGTGGTAYATAANFVITGAVTGDIVTFGADGASLATALTATTAGASVGATITAIESAAHTIGGHGVAFAVYGGNTYLAETVTGTLAATDTAIVEIVGSHTFTAATGHVVLAS